MKRFFSLLTLLVMILTTGGYVHAQTTYSLDKTTKRTVENGTATFESGITIYGDGRTYADGADKYLKNSVKYSKNYEYTITLPENISATSITFIGYANDNKKTSTLTIGNENVCTFNARVEGGENVSYTYDLTDGQKTLAFKVNVDVGMVIVVTEPASDKLKAPTFSYDEVAGKVTINANGAKEIRYTTDGTEPSATTGTVYTDAFEASNVTVKAIAISDGTKENSDVATYEVPAKLLSTVVDLTKVTIDGTELAAEDLQTLLNNKSFTSTASYTINPVIKYTETTTKYYNNNTNTSNAEEKTATVVRGEDNFTTSFTVNETTYTITLPINKDVTVEAPTHVAVNGTVALSCATEGASISYKIGDGEYQEYTRPFTILDEDAKVTAKAYIGEKETACEAFMVEAVKCTDKVKTLWFYYDTDKFDIVPSENTAGVKPTVTGKTGTECEGYVIEMNKDNKTYQNVSDLTINGNTYKTIKVSNGVENILKMPEGVKANRITIYSVINADASNKVSGWKNVNGTQEYNSIPMGAYKGSGTDYDVRVYPLNNVTDQISFTNTGEQLGFVIALDIVDEPATTTTDITIGTAKMATYCNTSAWEIPAGMEVYTAKYADGKVKLNKVTENVVPANTGVVLYGEPKTYTANLTTTESTLSEDNELRAATTDVTIADNDNKYILVYDNANKIVRFGKASAGTLSAGKAYLEINDANAAKQLSIDFNGETTGINTVENVTEAQNNVYYTLGGQRTVKPVKGLYIHNGKKYMK